MADSYSHQLAVWSSSADIKSLPSDIVELTKQRILDVIGVALPSVRTSFGKGVHAAAAQLGRADESTAFGFGTRLPAPLAALVNGALAHEFEFDDTHNEGLTHVSSPIVVTALALGEALNSSGRDVLLAVALGNEISSRIPLVAPGEFYRSGYHPTGVAGTFGTAYTACKLHGLDAEQTANAAGIAGSQTSGSMESWSDGASAKSLHPGLSAQSGITAAALAKAGITGPTRVFEGRWGFFHQHVKDDAYPYAYDRLVGDLGARWDSRNISFKPYPTGHLFHAFLDAAQALYAQGVRGKDIARVICPIADYMVPIVCEPVAEKMRPATTWHARVSLQFSLAEMFHFGKLDVESYSIDRLQDPTLLDFARRVEYVVDAEAPGRNQWKGWVIVELHDGRRLEHVQPFNRGSPQNPLSRNDVEDKFRANSIGVIGEKRAEAAIREVRDLESEASVRDLARLCVAP